MPSHANRIIGLYEDHALAFDADRHRGLFEQPWLDRFLDLMPPSPSVLDVGCGMGEPVARYLIERGCMLTGVDGAPAMIALCRQRFPQHDWNVADMRGLSLGHTFRGVLAWNSLIHLERDAQRRMFRVFAEHATSGSVLMFTSGDEDDESISSYRGEPLYHASLAPAEYRALLEQNGFEVVAFVPGDPSCENTTVWLARYAP
ncbi:class I SAM-dependent methyltransferase [Pendulispora rubella]|uniref:Class I SAM-dependent methyltransferase n=1 Tax=Pendulispora rubella TaxID=2741070 RepID=A0ABZ2KT46_9BACT